MCRRMWLLTSLLSILALNVYVVYAISKQDLYPFGEQFGDSKLSSGDDVSSAQLFIRRTSIRFFDDDVMTLNINTNGVISFDRPMNVFKSDDRIPLGHRIIAPYLADVDTGDGGGHIYYRDTDNSILRNMTVHYISRAFANHRDFRPASLFIATWDEVGHYNRQHQKNNTFQAVIASNGTESFVFFLYPLNRIQWTVGDGKEVGLSVDVPAQAGFDNGASGKYYTLPESGTSGVNVNLMRNSNIGIPGLWIFRVGNLAGGTVGHPSTSRTASNTVAEAKKYQNRFQSQTRQNPNRMFGSNSNPSLSGSGGLTDSLAQALERFSNIELISNILRTDNTCDVLPEQYGYETEQVDDEEQVDYSYGTRECSDSNAVCENNCCLCNSPYIGNGYECIRTDETQRVAGVMRVNVNGETVNNIAQHTYVTTDGRMCSAFSGIPPTVGLSLQSVYAVGSIFGFLFAVPQDSTACNGFMRVGGMFIRNATLEFRTTRGIVAVEQVYPNNPSDRSVFGTLHMSTTVNTLEGQLPSIAAGARVRINNYTEEYRRITPGVMSSSTTHTLHIDNISHRFRVNQTIQYKECPGRPESDLGKIRIRATSNRVTYISEKQILRFCQTTRTD